MGAQLTFGRALSQRQHLWKTGSTAWSKQGVGCSRAVMHHMVCVCLWQGTIIWGITPESALTAEQAGASARTALRLFLRGHGPSLLVC